MKGENMSDIQKILNAVADLLDSTEKPETVSIVIRTINRTLDGVSSYDHDKAALLGLGAKDED